MDLFNLSGVISLNADKFNKQAEEADQKGKKLGERLKDITDTAAGRLLSRGIEELGSALVGVARKAIDLTGELEQNLGGSKAVFGDWAVHIQEAGKAAYKNLGLSQSQYLAEANKMGSLLQGMGFKQQESLEMTATWMQRAADVASIMGIDVSDAMQAIEGAAKGNFTMMDNLGVAMNATTLEAYRLEKGLSKPYAKMTQMEKIELAYQMFLEKTNDYQGNYAKENDTLAGSLTTLNAAWENLLSGVGDGTEVWDSAELALKNIWKTVKDVFPKIWNNMKTALKKNWPKIADQMGQFLRNLPQTLGRLAEAGADGLIDIINATFGSHIPHIKDIRLPSWQEIEKGATDAINEIIKWINKTFGANIPTIDTIHIPSWEEIKDWAVDQINNITTKINELLGTDIPKITEIRIPSWEEIQGWAVNQINTLTGHINNIFGTKIPEIKEIKLPTWDDICNWAEDRLNEIVTSINNFLGINPPEVGEVQFPSIPEMVSTIGQWWNEGGAKERIADVCTWVLGWFSGTPEGDLPPEAGKNLSTWWSGVKGGITDACNWVLGIFDNPPEKKDAVQAKVSEWWGKVRSGAESATTWVLKMFNLPDATIADIREKVSRWWSQRFSGIGHICKWVLSLPSFPSANEAGLDLHNRFVTWWNGAKQTMLEKFNFLREIIGHVGEALGEGDATSIAERIQNFWDRFVVSKLKLQVDFIVGALGYKNFESMMVDFKYTMTRFLYDTIDMIPGLSDLLGIGQKRETLEQNYAIEKRVAAGDLSEGDARNLYNILSGLQQLRGTGNAETMTGWLYDQYFGEGFTEKLNTIAEGGYTDFDAMFEAASTVFSKLQELSDAADSAEGFEALRLFMNATGFNADQFGTDPETYKEFAQNTLEALKSITENPVPIEADTQPAETAVQGLVDSINGTSASVTVYANPVGCYKDLGGASNAKGLDYVPNNGYISELHRGEAILSGNEARAWRENGGRGQNYGGAGEVVAAIQSLGNDISNMRMFVGERAFGGVVVDYGGRGMNNYLGASSKRHRRGYGRT